MSVIINLLPDTRLNKQRNHKKRQLIGTIAFVVWGVCGGAILLLIIALASEKVVISQLSNSIKNQKKQLESQPNLLDALTAQQAVNSLSALYSQRTYLSKFFDAYGASNPTGISLNSLNIDNANLLTVSGTAPTYAGVAKLAKALEVYKAVGSATPDFTAVDIKTVARSDGKVAFNLTSIMSQGVTRGN